MGGGQGGVGGGQGGVGGERISHTHTIFILS